MNKVNTNVFEAHPEDIYILSQNPDFNINEVNYEEHNALFNCDPEKALALIKCGIDIQHINGQNENALFFNSHETVQILLDNNISVFEHNNKNINKNIFTRIDFQTTEILLKYLKKRYPDKSINDLFNTQDNFFKVKDFDSLNLLINNGLDISHIYFSNYWTEDLASEMAKKPHMVKLLFENKDKISHFNYIEEALIHACPAYILKIIIDKQYARDSTFKLSREQRNTFSNYHSLSAQYLRTNDLDKIELLLSHFELEPCHYHQSRFLFNKDIKPETIDFWVSKGIDLDVLDDNLQNPLFYMLDNKFAALKLVELGVSPYQINYKTKESVFDFYERCHCTFIDELRGALADYEKKNLTQSVEISSSPVIKGRL